MLNFKVIMVVPVVNPILLPVDRESDDVAARCQSGGDCFWDDCRPFRSRAALEAEIVVLRQQLNVLRRACPKKLPFNSIDRLILGAACRQFSEALRTRPDCEEATSVIENPPLCVRSVYRDCSPQLTSILRGRRNPARFR
jgi:hypothetical protein